MVANHWLLLRSKIGFWLHNWTRAGGYTTGQELAVMAAVSKEHLAHKDSEVKLRQNAKCEECNILKTLGKLLSLDRSREKAVMAFRPNHF